MDDWRTGPLAKVDETKKTIQPHRTEQRLCIGHIVSTSSDLFILPRKARTCTLCNVVLLSSVYRPSVTLVDCDHIYIEIVGKYFHGIIG